MGSSRAKGRRSLNKVKEYYEQEGYLVDEVELGGRFRKSKDLFATEDFGGFDLIAMKPGLVEFIQVKTNSPATQQPYKDFAALYTTSNIKVVCATVYDYQGIRLQYYEASGLITEKDLRT